MKASWEKIENKSEVILHIEADVEKVAEALDKAFKKVVQKVNVPGFRKGKVPRSLFETKFGVESLYQDALDILLPEVYSEALNETKIEPIDSPEVDIEQFGKGQILKFTAKVTVKPEIELGEYKGLELPANEAVVTPEEMEAELKRLQERHAELVVIEEGAVQTGDTAVIDFEGFLEGIAFPGGKGDNHPLEIGSGSFIPGFEEQVIGMQKGEVKDIEVSFPENYHAEELKGKPAVFKVTVQDIKRKILPELDDEFAKDVSEFETLEEYKQDIEKNMIAKKEHDLFHQQEAAVVEKASENAKLDVPQVMIEHEIEHMLRDFENNLKTQGLTLDLYYQFSGLSADQLKEQMKADAEKRVRNNLVLEAISKAENIEVTDEDVNAELEKMSKQYQRSVEDLQNILAANGSIETLKNDLVIKKTVDFLMENSKKAAEVA